MRNHLPLSGETAVTSRDAEEEGIVVWELSGGEDGVAKLGRGMELLQDVLGKSLCDPARRRLGGGACWDGEKKTDWKMLAEPPATSTPDLTLSATV